MHGWAPNVVLCSLLLLVVSMDGSVHGGRGGTIAYYYFMPSVQAMPPTPPPAPLRAVFYPVRTNCNRPCPTQHRYRWNYRPPAVMPPVAGSSGGPVQPSPVSNVLSISYPMPRVNSSGDGVRTTVVGPPASGYGISASTPYPTLSTTAPVDSRPITTDFFTTLPTPPPYTQNLPTKRPNPCRSGTPLLSENNKPMTCNFVVRPNGGCPHDYWCHTGSSFETTTCCPNDAPKIDACALPRANGDGDELIPRWYFDRDLHKCRRFLYRGMRGNANNFITSMGCIERCERSDRAASVTKNPCGSGPPARDLSGELFSCVADDGAKKERTVSSGELADGDPYRLFSSKSTSQLGQRRNAGCPAGYYCHVGETAQTTTCCELSAGGEVCRLEVNEGEGGADLARWYFDWARGECVEFSYRGMRGNENNFVSREKCEAICRQEKVEELHILNPCSSSDMLVEPNGTPRHCNTSTPCPVNYWCHRGATPESTVCCTGVRRACDLPVAEGSGRAVLSRWYYDKAKQGCRKFLYSGVGGNQNSYITEEECLNACPANDNPCSSGHPLMVDNQPKVCSPQHRCPGTHFCHISAPEIPNYCCPKNGDPCEHPMSEGIGPYAITRYFFDKNARRCTEFVYRGAKGNANNFLTIEDCQIVCQAGFKNPCKGGFPLLDPTSSDPVICGGEDPHCPSGYFCHVGSGPETTNCCPGTRNACELPIEAGGGRDQLERWGYDGGTRVCRQFTYSGLKGNVNNFLSKEHCAQACNEVNPCLNGDPLTSPLGERVACHADNPESCLAPSDYFCHVGPISSTTVCCPRSEVRNVCDLPVNHGDGDASLTRWHYNGLRSECSSFQYHGIRGNENNFGTREACERACGLTSQRQPLCPHGAPLMDEKLGKPVDCGPYRGCPSSDYVCHNNVERDAFICCENPAKFCLEPREPGHCSGNDEERYGYNPLTDSCVPYKYTGCGGSLNNFKSLERCTEVCCREYRRRMRDE